MEVNIVLRRLTIGQLAKHADVNVETIRYYQRVGLIQEPIKPERGYRLYPESKIDRIKFIKRAQQLGFALTEIGDLLLLGEGKCSDVRELAIEKRNTIKHQIDDLITMKNELDSLIDACQFTEATLHYALIDTLARSRKLEK